jgi:hypothetical protein
MPRAWRGVVISGRVGQCSLSRKLRWRRALRVVAGPRVSSGWQLPFSQLMPTSWHSLRQSQLVGDNSCSAFPRFVCAGTPRTNRSAERMACNFEEMFMHYVLLGVRENFHARQHAIGPPPQRGESFISNMHDHIDRSAHRFGLPKRPGSEHITAATC